MSIKLSMNGAVLPTEVHNEILYVHVGSTILQYHIPFFKDEYEYDNTYFPMSYIMGYFKCSQNIIILRFNGTATKYTLNKEVIGFTKFDSQEVLDSFQKLDYGSIKVGGGKLSGSIECSIYLGKTIAECILENTLDPEPIIFLPKDNPLFVEDIITGNRYSPCLHKIGDNLYEQVQGRYQVVGSAAMITGEVQI